jgi:hypothetical protein
MLGVNGPQAEQNEIEKLSPLTENCLITPDLSNWILRFKLHKKYEKKNFVSAHLYNKNTKEYLTTHTWH